MAALSLLKFAALLIEVAAKAKYVVSVIDELADKAHFDKPSPGDSKPSKEFVSAFGTLQISLTQVLEGFFGKFSSPMLPLPTKLMI